jgi:hypothetical protein
MATIHGPLGAMLVMLIVAIEGGGWRFDHVTWFPAGYSNLRLQYNRNELASSMHANSLWLQLETFSALMPPTSPRANG